jgi:quinol monooxygenase YgiN
MAIKVFLEIEIKPELLDESLKTLNQALPDTRAFDGCLGIEVLQDSENPNHIILDELWESQEKQQKYLKWREETGFTEKMMAVLSAPLVIKFFNIRGTY